MTDGSCTLNAGSPHCSKHHRVCVLRVVRKDGENKGRQFYTCPLPRETQCDYFEVREMAIYLISLKGTNQFLEWSWLFLDFICSFKNIMGCGWWWLGCILRLFPLAQKGVFLSDSPLHCSPISHCFWATISPSVPSNSLFGPQKGPLLTLGAVKMLVESNLGIFSKHVFGVV